METITILGATGSIGQSTIDVVVLHPDRFKVRALSGHTRMAVLAQAAKKTMAECVVVPDSDAARVFRLAWGSGGQLPEIRVGSQALEETAAEAGTDIVMAAIVGIAGLPSVLSAARAGKKILLANKESLVAAGSLLMAAVENHGATLLPIDSEHNAIFQCMPNRPGNLHASGKDGVRKLILTASGGPFRQIALSQLKAVTPDQACAHPNWDMGRKISVDSATMLNKGLEVIEAHWLFSMPPDQIEVLIHPQSIVHSMVQYADGSVLAQLGNPDMRTPIAHALAHPERIEAGVTMLDLAAHGKLEFESVDDQRYPCLGLAYDALHHGQAACIALNAANEVAVDAFLRGQITYLQIHDVVARTLNWQTGAHMPAVSCLGDILEIDRAARTFAAHYRQNDDPLISVSA